MEHLNSTPFFGDGIIQTFGCTIFIIIPSNYLLALKRNSETAAARKMAKTKSRNCDITKWLLTIISGHLSRPTLLRSFRYRDHSNLIQFNARCLWILQLFYFEGRVMDCKLIWLRCVAMKYVATLPWWKIDCNLHTVMFILRSVVVLELTSLMIKSLISTVLLTDPHLLKSH